jgi:hypothetical protein
VFSHLSPAPGLVLAAADKITRRAQPHAQQRSLGAFFAAGSVKQETAAGAGTTGDSGSVAAPRERVTLPPVAWSSFTGAKRTAGAPAPPAAKKREVLPAGQPSLAAFFKPPKS